MKRYKVLSIITVDGKDYKQGDIVFLNPYWAKRWDSCIQPMPQMVKRNKGTVAKRFK
jgi:hypothetical protein